MQISLTGFLIGDDQICNVTAYAFLITLFIAMPVLIGGTFPTFTFLYEEAGIAYSV
jgi:hypothetical protein